jgi:TRAP-type uncharacterized transport system fused permease subunit
MSSLGEAASKGAISLAKLAPLSACMSMVIYIFGLSGITVKFSHLIMEIGQSNIILALFPAAVIPLLLGMSVPPVAAYVISAAIVAPALIQLGVVDIVAHFFVFYISCLAPFTPPICAACFVAAAIADAPWLKIGWIAIRLGFVAYLVSFMIVINPALLGIGTPGEVLQAVVMGLLGTVVMVSGFLGYFASRLNIFARLLLVASGFLMIWPETSTDIVGLVVAVATLTIATLISRRKVKKSAYA